MQSMTHSVPVLLVVAASSGAGKTTLLERLIPALATRGIRTAIVKLTHHDVDPDPEGKDSRRLRDAGATAAVLAGPRVTSLFVPRRLDVPALAALAAGAAPTDLVLVEGGRDVPVLPRIEVVAPGGALHTTDASLLVAVATDDGHAPDGVRVFPRADANGMAAHVATWLAQRR